MAKQDTLEFKGKIIDLLPNAMFRVKLENDHIITAHAAGKLRKNRIRVLQGDNVTVEVIRGTGVQSLMNSQEVKK